MRCLSGLFLLAFTSLAVTEQKRQPVRGPRVNETKRFRYESASDPGLFHYCLFCPKRALDDSTYSYMQVTSCLNNYPQDVNWSEALTPYEWKNRKFPFCNEGETPGCGPPPVTHNIDWKCEKGYSEEIHSVYFPCQGQCNITNEIHYHAYCNASLKWEVTDVSNGSQCRVIVDASTVRDGGISQELMIGLIVVGIVVVSCLGLVYICIKRNNHKKKENPLENGDIEQQHIPPNRPNDVHVNRQGQNPNQGQGPNHRLAGGGPGMPAAQPGQEMVISADSGHSEAGAKVHQNGNCRKKDKNLKNSRVRFSPPGNMGSAHSGLNNDSSQTIPKVLVNSSPVDRSYVSVESQATGSDESQTLPKGLHISEGEKRSFNNISSNTNPKILEKNNLIGRSSVGSQVAVGKGSQTGPRYLHHSEAPHSFPVTATHVEVGLQTGSLDSPCYQIPEHFGHVGSHDSAQSGQDNPHSPASSQTSVATSGSQTEQYELAESLTSSRSSNSEANHLSLNDNDEEEDVESSDENSSLLPKEDTSTANRPVLDLDETERLLTGESARDQINSGRNRNLNIISSSLTGSSLKVPCEHELPPETGQCDDDDDDTEEKLKATVMVMAWGHKQEKDSKFYVTKDEPFTVVAKSNLGKYDKFNIERKGNGPAFKGKALTGISDVPLLHVDRACSEDTGMFSWSLLSERGALRGIIEIGVVDKDDRLVPQGSSVRENTVEVRREPTIQNLKRTNQNLSIPSQLFGGAPSLNIDSVLKDTEGHLQQQTQQNIAVGSILDDHLPQRCELSQSRSQELVKGERCDSELGNTDVDFCTLDPATFSNGHETREGPSGISAGREINNSIRGSGREESGAVYDGEEETSRKCPVDVVRPANCCIRLKDSSEKLRANFAGYKLEMRELARRHRVDESVLMALEFAEEEDDSQVVLYILDLLGEEGLRIGHIVQYLCQSVTNRDNIAEIVQREHSNCPFCSRFFS